MAFEVIPGGLCLEDDIPAPDKPIEEWTPEEHEEYNRYLYDEAEPGTPEAVIKGLAICPAAIRATIETLEAIRAACGAEAEATGYRSEWPYITTPYLLTLLQLRERSEAGPVPDQSAGSVPESDTGNT